MNKELCKRCTRMAERNGYGGSWNSEEDLRWEEGWVSCPPENAHEPLGVGNVHCGWRSAMLDEPPPKWCHFLTEQIVSEGTDDG